MQTRDVVVVGASAGGVQALREMCGGLPPDFPATVLIVQHVARHTRSVLSQLLARGSRVPVADARNGQQLEPGRVYVAPPDRHLMIQDDRLVLTRGPHENGARPAIDALFRSAAVHCGSRVVGVVLTGTLDDGTEGLIAIHQAGGVCVAQDPKDAAWPSMPESAIRRDHVDHIVPLREVPALLTRLVVEAAGPSGALPAETIAEDRIAHGATFPEVMHAPGQPSELSCPDCGGVLNQITHGQRTRFRCQIGHAFTQLGLRDAQLVEITRGLTIAMRTHRERMALFTRMARDAEKNGHPHTAQRWQEEAVNSARLSRSLQEAMAALDDREGD